MSKATGVHPSPDELEAMLQRILETGKKTGTPVGLHVQTVEAVEQRIAEGWRFIACGSEVKFMVNEAQRIVTGLNLKSDTADLARY